MGAQGGLAAYIEPRGLLAKGQAEGCSEAWGSGVEALDSGEGTLTVET